MKYLRVWTDDRGESHFEDVEVKLSPGSGQSDLSEIVPATGVIFRRSPADQHVDWHPAPRRQFVITLSGTAELQTSDGEVRQIGPGSVVLVEDVTGKGHITRGTGTEERLSLFVPLGE